MVKLFFVGTGGSVATPLRDNTAFLLSSGADLVLVDCPGSIVAKLGRLGFDYRRIRSVLLTHTHPDHIYGLPSFIHSLMLEEGEIEVWASEETVSFSRHLLDLFGLRSKRIKTRIRFRPLRSGQKARLGKSLTFQALRVPHHTSSMAYHFSFEDENKEVLISGDTPIYSTLFEKARGIDCLAHDCSAPSRFFSMYPVLSTMHTSSLDLGRWSQEAGVRSLVPCHFLGEIQFSPAEIRREIRRHFKGRLIIPRDLQNITL